MHASSKSPLSISSIEDGGTAQIAASSFAQAL